MIRIKNLILTLIIISHVTTLYAIDKRQIINRNITNISEPGLLNAVPNSVWNSPWGGSGNIDRTIREIEKKLGPRYDRDYKNHIWKWNPIFEHNINWGHYYEDYPNYEIPEGFKTCNKKSPIEISRSKGAAWWSVISQDTEHTKLWVKLVGGPPYDQYSAWVTLQIPWTYVRTDIEDWAYKYWKCGTDLDIEKGSSLCACVINGRRKSREAANCIKKGDPRCDLFEELKFRKCVSNDNKCQILLSSECSNSFYNEHQYIFVPNSNKCHQ
ncbi:MAG: hypothetical protein JAY94_14725 [Candidatus Thiodiazotropha endolucinida]|nr:hypothetical protein [Candidatus Thiodiazotropha taylori]MCW4318766.1 hypothetical protein [Candidatus Thiodiazotropha taylori]